MTTPTFAGIHHVALNVRDLDRSVRWYADVLGFVELFPYDTADFDRRLMRHPGGAIVALTTHHHPAAAGHFSEQRPGLDHLSFAVASHEALEGWVAHLDALGVTHSGISVTPVTGSTLIAFRDPDNIQLELYGPQGVPTG